MRRGCLPAVTLRLALYISFNFQRVGKTYRCVLLCKQTKLECDKFDHAVYIYLLLSVLCENPEKLANAGGRCWKDTLGRKRSIRTHQPPYPTRRGLVTTWQEIKKLLYDDEERPGVVL